MLKLRSRRLSDHGERLIPQKNELWEFADHLSRYVFAQNFISDGTNILEVGCGAGYGLRKLSEPKSIRGIGIDTSREAVLFAKKHSSSQHCLEFVVMDGTNLGFRDNVFDTVFSLEVIEHVTDYQAFVKESCRVLKFAGKYIISTPKKNPSPGFAPCPFHLKEFTKEELSSILNRYFAKIRIFGKRITNKKFLAEQEKLSKTNRNRLLSLVIAHFPNIRFLARYLPRNIKKGVTGYPRISLTLNDFEITTATDNASDLIAVATKNE